MYDWLLLIQTSADTRLGTWHTLMLTDLFSHYTYIWLCFPQQKGRKDYGFFISVAWSLECTSFTFFVMALILCT